VMPSVIVAADAADRKGLGCVVQLVRTPARHAGGPGFESRCSLVSRIITSGLPTIHERARFADATLFVGFIPAVKNDSTLIR
jgi:hypothetical protein